MMKPRDGFTARLKVALEELAGLRGDPRRYAVRRGEIEDVNRITLRNAREVQRVGTVLDDLDTDVFPELRAHIDDVLEQANRLGRIANRAYQAAQDVRGQLERRALEQITQLHQVQEAIRESTAYVIDEQYVLIREGQEALVTTRQELVASLEETTAQINEEKEARATADSALALQVSQVAAQLTSDVSELTAQISTETQARVDADVALASTATQITADVVTLRNATTGGFTAILDSLDALFSDRHAEVNVAGGFGQPGTVLVTREAAPAPDATGATNAGAVVLVPEQVALSLAARRIKISVLARSAQVNGAAGFSVAYSTADNGNSGLMSANLSSVWGWHSFYYDVPVPVTGGVDYLGIFGDNAASGKVTEVARLVIEIASEAADLPEIADLEGEINSVRSLVVDSNEAFATMIENINVRAADTEADVSAIGSAVATLEGNSQAAYVLRARAGDQSGALEIAAWEDAQGGGSAVTLNADYIFAKGTLQADLLAVGVAANELSNSDLSMGLSNYRLRTSGTIGSSGALSIRAAGGTYAGFSTPTIDLRSDASPTSDGYALVELRPELASGSYSVGYDAVAGEFYEFHAGISGNNALVYLRVYWYTADGSYNGVSTAEIKNDPPPSYSNDPGRWPRYGGVVQAPTGTAYAKPAIELQSVLAGGNARVRIVHPFLGKTTSLDAKLSNYGTGRTTLVTGDGIATRSVTAEHMSVSSLSAISATIGHFKSAESGGRLELKDDQLKCFRDDNSLAVLIGYLGPSP